MTCISDSIAPTAPDASRWVESIAIDDPLFLVGDVCDFWYAARQRRSGPLVCEGLRALERYSRNGGALTILPGNHDLWLGPYYEAELGANRARAVHRRRPRPALPPDPRPPRRRPARVESRHGEPFILEDV